MHVREVTSDAIRCGLLRCEGCAGWEDRMLEIVANAKTLQLCWRCTFRILAVAAVYAAADEGELCPGRSSKPDPITTRGVSTR